MARRKRREVALDILVGLVAVLALFFVIRERLVPWVAERAVVDPGETVTKAPALINAETGDSLPFRRDADNLLLVFRSTCPTCQRTVPAWNALAGSEPWLTTAIGLESPENAAAYANQQLPAARIAVPRDIHRFTNRFRIDVVPTTLVISRAGRLVARHVGPLEESDIEALRRLVAPSAP